MKGEKEAPKNDNKIQYLPIDKIPDSIVWLNKTGRIIECNDIACKSLGYNRKELLKLTISEIDPDCDFESWKERWDNVVIGNAVSFNSFYRRKDGRIYSIEVTETLIEIGGVEYMCAISRDVSAYKDREKILQEALFELQVSDKLLRQSHFTIENLPGALFWLDRQGSISSANSTSLNRLGYTSEELASMTFFDISPELSSDDWQDLWDRIKVERVVNIETKHKKKNGEVIPVFVKSTFVEFEGEQFSVSIALDISKRIEAEAVIREQHHLLNETINSLTHPFYVLDAKTYKVILANNASGYLPDGPKQTCYSLNHDMTKPCSGVDHICPIQMIKKKRESVSVEHLHKDKEGNDRYFEIHSYPIFNDKDEITRIIEYSIDITDRKKADDSLRSALAEVKNLKNQLEAENVYLQQEIKLEHNFEEIISKSKSFRNVLTQVQQVAATEATVLILGETGTGKELLARAVHNISKRRNRPLVKVNCAALQSHLIESELFGHEKGAFTGAHAKRVGRFELANGGTIFLDEIGELPLDLQTKLLRVLQEGEFERLGSSQTIKVDARIIAATNVALEEAVTEGNFRSDLYYRLNVFPISIPPLRDRRDDIPILVSHFVKKYSLKNGKKIESVHQKSMKALTNYNWPGNIRELENIIERAVIITAGGQLELGDWLPAIKPGRKPQRLLTLNEMEKEHIEEVLEMTGWRVSGDKGAAKILDMKPTTLEARMKKLGIEREK
jgi:PAS domain S-box-containing protein